MTEIAHQSQLAPSANKFHVGNGDDGKHYWLTPPALYASLNARFRFDFDPCPYPKPADFDGLTSEWGLSSYVNPPFGSILHQGPGDKKPKKKGPTAWARKAIEESRKGKRVVLVYPVDKWLLMLLAAGVNDASGLRDFAERVMEAAADCCTDPDAGPDSQTSVAFTGEEGTRIANDLHRLIDSRAGDAGEGDRYTQGYAQGQADAAQLHQWMQDKAWQDTVLMLVHYQTLAERTWLVGHEEAAAKLAEWWRHARVLSETKSVEDIAATPAVDAECPSSLDGRHQVDTSMESGPNNCFHCEAPMGGRHAR